MLVWWVAAAIAASGPLQAEDVPLAEGAWPAFPMTEAAYAAGASTCTAAVTLAEAGAVGQVEVSGCGEPFLGLTRDAASAMKVTPGFAKKNASFQVQVPYVPPPLARRTPSRKTLGVAELRVYTLDEAVRIAAPPEQIVRKDPFAPPGVKQGGCSLELFVDDRGSPYAIDLRDCREDMRLAVEMAAMAWVFQPVVVDGAAAPVRFHIPITVRN